METFIGVAVCALILFGSAYAVGEVQKRRKKEGRK